jgi:predicted TIM-barrel fold metal-dependent hydrolase
MLADLSDITILDSHEHLAPESERACADRGGDALATIFSHYASTDLLTAGLSPGDLESVRDVDKPLGTRWELVEPHWHSIRNTGYGHALLVAARDLYGIPDINGATIAELDERMRAASVAGLYSQVLERANIRLAIVQDLDDGALPLACDPPNCTRKVIKGHPLVLPRSQQELEHIARSVERPRVHSLSDWLDVCEAVFELASDAVGLKLPHAYVRTLATAKPTFHEAESVFNRIERKRELYQLDESVSWEEAKPLQDYLVRHLIEMATKHGLPIQIHTGILEGTFGDVRNAHPHHLVPLLLDYREARFVLFHGGYPWIHEFAVLGKSFPNVWLDLCWLWVISGSAGRTLLHELIETVPSNKVCAFGGDYIFIEGVYGYARMALENISRVLEEKVQERWLTKAEAVDYARAILHDNAASLYDV